MSVEIARKSQIEALISEILSLESSVSQIDEELAQIVAARSSVEQEVAALEAEVALADQQLAQQASAQHPAPLNLRDRLSLGIESVKQSLQNIVRPPSGSADETEHKLVLAGCTVVLLGLLATFAIALSQNSIAKQQQEPAEALITASAPLAADISLAEQAIRDFYRCDSLDQILSSIREPRALTPTIEAYYQVHPIRPSEVTVSQSQRVQCFDQTFILSVVHLSENGIERQVAVQMEDEHALIDWELAVNSQQHFWQTASLTDQAIQIRAEISPSDYYNFNYMDDQWVSFELRLPENETPHYGYARRRGAKALELQRLIESKTTAPLQAVIVVSLSEEDPFQTQMEILNLSHPQWLLPDDQLPIVRVPSSNTSSLLTAAIN